MQLNFEFLNTKLFEKYRKEKLYLKLQEKVKEIAVYKGGGGLGDLVCAIPFFKTIRTAFPRAKIYYMGIIYPRFEKIFKAIAYFDGYIYFERPNKGKGFKKYLACRKQWKGRIGLLIDTQRRWETSFWLRYLEPKYMLSSSIFLSNWPMPGLNYKRMHVLEQMMCLPARLGIADFDLTGAKLSLLARSRLKAEKFLSGFRGGKFAGLFPGCGMNFKNWPLEHYAKLGDLLVEKGYNVLILGSPRDIELLRGVSKKMKCSSIIPLDIAPQLCEEILDEAAIMERCQVIIGNDSGSMHLASFLGCLSVTVFGPTTPRKFSPIGVKNIVFYKNLPCSPCRFKCRRKIYRECLSLITPEEISRQINQYLT